MNKKVFITIGVIAVVAIGVLVWLNKENEKQEIIKIGAILPLTGDLAKYGQSGKNAIELAINEYNGNHQQKIEVVFEDDKGESKTAINSINKLIAIDKVAIIVGAMPSSNTLAIAPIAEKNKVVLVSPTSTASAVRDAGDYIFRICVSDDLEGKSMADYLIDNQNIKNIGILYINNDYGVGLANDFEKEIVKHGGNIKEKIGYQEGSNDFKTIINKFQVAKVDVIYIVAYKEQNYFFSQCAQMNYKPLFTGGTMIEDPDLLNAVKDFANGILYTYRNYNPESNDVVSKKFVEAYKSKYGIVPDFYAAANFDAISVAIKSVANVEYNGTALKNYIYNINDMNGVTGKISFDEKGDIIQGFGIKTIENGKFLYLMN
ncbi:MAG: penicillin-binding protein activator [Dysgonamonadaceae bacterium]|jgi:branched-chain amino acid transport system substrate-binding protein|nr:penicillin-binding protein activator [Dysgonamonadaceae bacterium]